MKEENDKQQNSVLLEGPVCSCSIEQDAKSKVIAKIEVCTAAKHKDKDRIRLSNPIIHRALVMAAGENAERIRELAKKTIDLSGDLAKAQCIRLEGELAANQKGQPYVSVQQNGIKFLEHLSLKNNIQLEGTVMETSHNSAYASAILRSQGANGNPVLIPINIYSKDNPRKYSDLCSGKIKKGDMLAVKGPLISRFYSNGKENEEVFRCSVNIDNYESLTRKKTQQKKTGLGI